MICQEKFPLSRGGLLTPNFKFQNLSYLGGFIYPVVFIKWPSVIKGLLLKYLFKILSIHQVIICRNVQTHFSQYMLTLKIYASYYHMRLSL